MMPIDNVTLIFVELAVGLLVAVILGSIARFFRQPLILAYITAGVLISILGILKVGEQDVLPLMASFGVIFLLFLTGVELRISDLKFIGKSAILAGIGQLVATFLAGLAITNFLNFGLTESIYISLALTFSSTVIVVKLLSEKKDLNSLYGQISIGILLVQDAAAILALIILSGFATPGETFTIATISTILLKGLIVILLAILLNRLILPATFSYSAASPELLLITALTFCFIFAAFTKLVGFSLEIGAFIAGVALATSPYHLAISAKIRPIRDFFVVLFFIFLGTNMVITQLGQFIIPVVVLSVFILVGTPIIVLVILGLLGHKKRTSFLTSVALAQISEFSLILVVTGLRLGHIGPEIVSLVAAVGIITITVSSYMITHSNWLYTKLAKYLDVFERKQLAEGIIIKEGNFSDHIVLVGAEQVGKDLLRFLTKKTDGGKIIVVDFNPAVIENLAADGINALYGDIADFELLADLNFAAAKLIISTVPDVVDNLTLVKTAKNAGFAGPIITTAYWAKDGVTLYEAGADFVLVPELAASSKVIRILAESWENLDQIRVAKPKHLEELLEKTKAST